MIPDPQSSTLLILDPQRIRAARTQRGITAGQLAGHLGISMMAMHGLEVGGSQRHLDTRTLHEMAEALDTPLGSLLIDRAPTEPEPEITAPAERVETIGALLANGGALPVETLADALGCSLNQADAAIRRLRQQLQGTGMTVYRFDNLVSIRPVHDVPDRASRTVERERLAALMPKDRSRLIHQLVGGPQPMDMRHKDDTAFDQLIKAGVIEPVPGQPTHVQLTASTRHSLRLGPPPDTSTS